MFSKGILTVGLIGYGFMGKAHSNAWRQAPHFFGLPVRLRLKTICGRSKASLRRAATQFGWEKAAIDWKQVVNDPEIDLIDICTPNDAHREIAIAAGAA